MLDLEVSTATLTALFSEFEDAVFITDTNRKFVYVNEAGERMFGYPGDEIIGQDPGFLYASEDDYNKVGSWRVKARELNASDRLRMKGKRKNGEIFIVDGTSGPMRNERGEIAAFVYVLRDMSWRRNLEREKASAHEQLEVALESLSEGFAYFDADDRLILCNQRYKEIYPKSAPAMVQGAHFRDILRYGLERGEYNTGGLSDEEWLDARLAAHQNPKPHPVEQELDCGRWLLINERRTKDGGIAGVRTDITAMKQAEARLKQAELRLRILNDSLPCYIAELARDRTYRTINELGASWLGRTRAELIGRKASDFMSENFLKTVLPYYEAACAGEVQRFIARLPYPDGVTRDVDLCYTPDFNAEGQVEAIFVFATDVTHLKTVERVLQGLYRIASSRQLDARQKIGAVLKLGVDAFDLQNGLVAAIEGNVHKIDHAFGSSEQFRPGETRELNTTYCRKVVETGKPVTVEFGGYNDFSLHMNYEDLGRESYIGAPLVVDGETYGTLCFCSASPRAKPFSDTDKEILRLLSDWIAHEIGRDRDFRQLQEAQAELQRLATTDDLTGVLNRREFIRQADKELARTRHLGRPLTAAVLDVDHFKQINDTLGHAAGDYALKDIARALSGELGTDGLLGRIGGEEFCAVLPNRSLEEAAEVAERLRKAVMTCHLPESDVCAALSISIGVAKALESDSCIAGAMSRADTALYQAKRQGRNRVIVANSENVETLLKPLPVKNMNWGE
ncbi:diguanylate cyclase [Stappia sp. GBMRC 2046]|uniref:Diguanylate cyclase n=1 Tax=Stappia sediminis TaxID=2692190 RepID=A0A7X3LV80_9HYPH|nr:diguanylate cyclase [Stappia sediminis]MXN65719.1 diguanylate cyclase [Stappia sediminis]